jgi:hypothetical protein
MNKGKIPPSQIAIKDISERPIAPEKMSDDELAKFVAYKLTQLAAFSETLKPYYLDLRERFAKKKSKSATIYGCRTWNQYCVKVLDRTKRAVNYFLVGGNPVSNRNAPPSPGGKRFPTQTVKVQMIEQKPVETTVRVEVVPEPTTEEIIAESIERWKPMQNFGHSRVRHHMLPPLHDPFTPMPAPTITRAALTWLGDDVLVAFEKSNYATVEPEEIQSLLSDDQLEILEACRQWFEQILRAGREAEK